MKIALVHTPLATPTGGERQVLQLAVELKNMGHEAVIYTNEVDAGRCFPDLMARADIRVVPFPVKWQRYPLNHIMPYYKALLGMRRIGNELAKDDFDLVNNHNFPSEWAIHYMKKKKNIPSAWMCNEPPFWFFLPEGRSGVRRVDWPLFELLDRPAVRAVDSIVVLSRFIGDVVKKTYGREARVIRSGVDTARFEGQSGEAFRKKHGLEGAFMMLQVGQFSPYKRQEDGIRALAALSKKHDNVKLVFIGMETAYKQLLLDLTSAYGLREKVLFLGAYPDEWLREAYAACDVFLYPAHQSWSLVMMEAMAAGKPVIVSDRCGASEVIDPGKTGFVMRHGNYRELARYVELLIEDGGLAASMGRNAHDYVKENFTWRRYARNMEQVFESITK